MPIVTTKKGNAGRHGLAGRSSHASGAWVLLAVLCIGAAAWLGLRGKRGSASPSPKAEPEPQALEARADTRPHDGAKVRPENPPRPVEGEGGAPGQKAEPVHAERPKPRDAAQKGMASGDVAPEPEEPPARPQRRKGVPEFDNEVEKRLEAVSRNGFGSFLPMRVNLSQEEVLEILRRPVEIYDDDAEETEAAKELTAEMKAEALKFIEAGGTINQFLRDCQAAANEARETVRDVQAEMKRILIAQGEEAAQAYLDEQNPRLREQGLEEVHIGEGLLRMLERRRAKEAEASAQ